MNYKEYENMQNEYEEYIKQDDFKQQLDSTTTIVKPYIINLIIDKIVERCDGRTEIMQSEDDRLIHTKNFLTMDSIVNDVLCNYTDRKYIHSKSFMQEYEELNDFLDDVYYELYSYILRKWLISKKIEVNEDILRDIANDNHYVAAEKIGVVEYDAAEDIIENIFGLSVDEPEEELLKNKIKLPENEIWNEIISNL